MAEGWRKLHNKDLHILYTLSDIFAVIKPRKMRRVEHVAGQRKM